MIRKILLFAAFIFSLTFASAQAVGEWKVLSQFSGNFDDIIETPEKVYYTSGQRLFSYDKDSGENYAYTTNNKLNDVNIAFVRYNGAGKYLFIGYDNGNIDLLYDNGRVVNMSDIKDATLTYTKGLKSAHFVDNVIYVGTDFGIVTINDKKHEVIESGIFGSAINDVFPVGECLFLLKGTDLYYSPKDGHHNTFNKFTKYGTVNPEWLEVANDNKTIVYKDKSNGNKFTRLKFKFEGGVPSQEEKEAFTIVPASYLKSMNGGQYVTTTNSIVMIDNEGKVKETLTMPSALNNQKYATYKGASSIWAADAQGIGNYNIEGGNLTVLADKFKPEGIVTDKVFFLKFDPQGNLWASNLGPSQYKAGLKTDGWATPQATTRIVNGHPQNMNLRNAAGNLMIWAPTDFNFHPEDANIFFFGSNEAGVFVLKIDEETSEVSQLHLFGENNSPLKGGWLSRVFTIDFDPEGNMWVGSYPNPSLGYSKFKMLPYKVWSKKAWEDIAIEDWQFSKHLGVDDREEKDITALFCKKSPVFISFDSKYGMGLGITKTNGTWGDTSDDVFFEMNQTVDQDGKIWNPTQIVCAVEDKDGRVWVGGSSGGVVVIDDPTSLDPTNQRVSRVKVPRNDGTDYADYLCETDMVYAIAIDNSNRKWIGTENSGVYLVSENGDKIIEHFTMDNSPLPSNQVLSIACDPNSNTVYFGLLTGIVSYNSTSSPAADDYTEVYAYPNPVRPDYNGYITISGLMENSLVKITDASGNLIYQTRSEGGTAIWDGFDSNHNRVKTGVYYVFASQNANGQSGCVTKIMVVR